MRRKDPNACRTYCNNCHAKTQVRSHLLSSVIPVIASTRHHDQVSLQTVIFVQRRPSNSPFAFETSPSNTIAPHNLTCTVDTLREVTKFPSTKPSNATRLSIASCKQAFSLPTVLLSSTVPFEATANNFATLEKSHSTV